MSRFPLADAPTDAPVTLHRVMQQAIAQGLKARYELPVKLSHELFVLLMQLNEIERGKAKTAARRRVAAEV
jgi:hypothetical protein